MSFWKSSIGKSLGGSGWGLGGNAFMFGSVFFDQQSQGKNFAHSATAAGVETYLFNKLFTKRFILPALVAGGAMLAKDVVHPAAMKHLGETRTAMRPFGQQTYNFADTQNRSTMRSRALGLIQDSKQNLRQVLGNEAAIFGSRYG